MELVEEACAWVRGGWRRRRDLDGNDKTVPVLSRSEHTKSRLEHFAPRPEQDELAERSNLVSAMRRRAGAHTLLGECRVFQRGVQQETKL